MKKYNINIRLISEELEIVFRNVFKITVEIIGGDSKYYYVSDNNIDTFSIRNKPSVLPLKRYFAKKIIVEIPFDYILDEIKINNVSGDVTLKNVWSNTFSIKTTSGNINAEYLNGTNISIDSISGYAKIKEIDGKNIALKTVSGKIMIDEVKGKTTLRTISGSVDIKKCANEGELYFSSISGRMIVNGSSLQKEYR